MEATIQKIYPLILAGGYGTRLWPLSREQFPKQFQNLMGQTSLLQATLKRFQLIPSHTPTLICNKKHRFLVAEQLQQMQLKAADIIFEPVSRNTAPAIGLGALHLVKQDPNAVMLVTPSDHWICDEVQFAKVINIALHYAIQGHIVTFGAQPTRIETGYGYIKVNQLETHEQEHTIYSLLGFVEKPDATIAQHYIESGDYLWNAGIYCFRADTYLTALQHYQPAIFQAIQAAYDKAKQDDFIRVDELAFAASPDISIDYAIMENIDGSKGIHASVIPIDGWSDIGSWGTLWEVADKDQHNNVVAGDVVLQDCSNSYIHAEHRLIATIGINHCIVVETADAVLVADKNQIHLIKNIINDLKSGDRHECAEHLLVRRPWGYYECVDKAERYQVKRITVNPGKTLSLQMHHHRSEHWVVVKGTAKITCDDKVFLLHENQSTYIPAGIAHRLENPGIIPLELIEVQSGSYLGEDDIIRLQDDYGRIIHYDKQHHEELEV